MAVGVCKCVEGDNSNKPCPTCNREEGSSSMKSLQFVEPSWWFEVSKENPKKVAVVQNGSPPTGPVSTVTAAKPQYISISFDDGTCRQVPVKMFAEDTKVEFKHSLTSSMDPEEFAKQFEKDLETLKKTGVSKLKVGLIAGGVILGAPLAIAAAPVALTAVGFTSAGIAGGSMAASMMSAAAVANGGGVAAGSAVAILQSVGAAGLGATGMAAVGSAGAAVGGAAAGIASKIWGK